jgi:hypothetical protein
MPVPSISGGITVLTTCDTGSNGIAPGTVLASSTPISATSRFAGFATGINLTGSGAYDPSGTPASAALMGGIFAITATDFTVANRLAFFHYYNTNRVSAITVDTGLMFYCNSSSLGTEEAAYAVNGGNNPISAYDCAVVNLNRSTGSHLYSGTFDPSDVTHVGSAANFDTGYSSVQLDTFGYVDPFVVINGTSGDKGAFTDITASINTDNARLNDSPTNNIHLCFFAWGVGDGSTETHFSETLKVWEFTKQTDFAADYGRAHINDNDIGYEGNASASDVVTYELCSWITESPTYWRSIGSTSASVGYVSCVTKNAGGETIIVDGHTYKGHLFDACGSIQANSPSLANCTIKNATAHAIDLDSGGDANITSLLLDGNQTAIRIDVAGAAVLDVTQFTFETTNTYYIEYTGTGTLTVTSPVSIASGKLNASGGGTITVVSPTVELEVTSNIAASDIKIFDTGTQTVEASATGTTASTTAAGTYDITVMKAGYLPQRQTGVVLGASSVTVAINLVVDPIYNASHGLAWAATTSPSAGQVHWARAARLGYLADNQQGVGVYSALIDFWIAQSALDNTEFPIVAVGPDRFDFTSDGTTASQLDSGSVTFWKGAGMTWEHATTGNDTHRFYSVKSVGAIGGTTKVRYVQSEGGTVNDVTLVDGVVDQVIQYFSDTNGDATADYNYDDHLVFRTFAIDYYQARNNVLSSFGVSALEPYEYTIVLANIATGTASGTQSFTPVVTNQQGSPVEEQTGYTFSFKVTETSNSKSPEEFLAQWLFDTHADPTVANLYGSSLRAFDLPCPVTESGGAYSSVSQFVENTEDATEKHGFYFEESSAYHPDFLQQQEDQDFGSSIYTTPVTAQISITNLPDDVGGDTELQIYNVTTSTLIYSGDPAGASYTDTYTNGDAAYASDGDNVRIRFAHANAGTTFEVGQTIVAATTAGIVADGNNFIAVDPVYATNGVDGSTVSKFSYTAASSQFNLILNSNYTAPEMFAFYCYTLTTTAGIEAVFGAWEAPDAGNYKNITAIADVFLDNETTSSKRQTDTARIYKDDGVYPVLEPTTSGFGIDVNWQNVVYVVTAGSILTAPQAAELTAAAGASTFNPATDIVEGSETWIQAMRLIRAEAAGKLLVAGTTVTIRDAADSKDRITATVDDDGQRTVVTTDAS